MKKNKSLVYSPIMWSWVQLLGECFLYAWLGLDWRSFTSLSISLLTSSSASLTSSLRHTEQKGSLFTWQFIKTHRESVQTPLQLTWCWAVDLWDTPAGRQGSDLALDTSTGRLLPLERVCLVKLMLKVSSSVCVMQYSPLHLPRCWQGAGEGEEGGGLDSPQPATIIPRCGFPPGVMSESCVSSVSPLHLSTRHLPAFVPTDQHDHTEGTRSPSNLLSNIPIANVNTVGLQ